MIGNVDSFDDKEINIQEIILILWRKKLIIIFFVALFGYVGFSYATKIAVPIYNSYSVTMLNPQSDQIIDIPSVLSQIGMDETAVQTEIQIIRSRILLGKVVDFLNLTEDPEFNLGLKSPTAFGSLKEKVKGLISSDTPKPSVDASTTYNNVVTTLLNSFSASVVPQTTAFKISVFSEDPKKAALIADTIAEQYVQSQIDVKRDATIQAIDWLSDQVSELKLDLVKAEDNVKRFKSETPMTSPEILIGLERQLKSVRDRIIENEKAKLGGMRLIEQLSVADGYVEKAAIVNDVQLDEIAFNAQFDDVVALEFDVRLETIILGILQSGTHSDSQLSTLHASEILLEKRIKTESEAFVELEQLTREVEASRTLYEHFLGRLKETSAQQGIQQADSRIISYAVVPENAASPNKKMIIFFAVFLGFCTGAGVVFLLGLRVKPFRTSQELERKTGISVVGMLPLIDAKNRKKVFQYLSDNPTSPPAEAIRNLRTSLMLSNIDQPPQVIMITSSIPGEGKTTTSAGLALNFAGMGKKVLLIEGDLRRLALNQYFKHTAGAPGLISVLAGKTRLKDVVWSSGYAGLDVLFGEKSDTNAADILSSERMHTLVSEARELYDYVIIDTPPALIVPDPRVASQFVDTVLFVVRWDSTHQMQVKEALNQFKTGIIGGLILNQIDPKGFQRYGYGYGYGYGYASQYGSDYYSETSKNVGRP